METAIEVVAATLRWPKTKASRTTRCPTSLQDALRNLKLDVIRRKNNSYRSIAVRLLEL
jgi:hypothetical protein